MSAANRGRKLNPLAALGVFSFVLFAWTLPLLLISRYPPEDFSSFGLRCVVLFYASTRLAMVIGARDYAPLTAVFWLFTYVAMALTPMAQLLTGLSPPVAVGVSRADLDFVSTVTLLGCIAFDVANATRKPTTPRNTTVMPFSAGRSRLRLVSIFSLLASGAFIADTGVALFFTSREEIGEALSETLNAQSGEAVRGIVTALGTAPVLVCMLYYLVLVSRGRQTIAVADWLLLTLLVAANVVVNNPISNSRFWSLAVLLGVGLAVVNKSRLLYGWFLILGTISAVLIFPVSDINRYRSGGVRLQTQSVWQTLSIKDYDQFTMTANTIAFSDAHGLSFGRQLSGLFLFWVPRSVWAEKPRDTGVEVGHWMQLSNVNLSSPLWAEAWIDFGIVGVACMFALAGALARYWDRAYEVLMRTQGDAAMLVGIAVVAGYEFILLRGPLLQATGRFVILLVFVRLLSERRLFRSRNGPGRRPPGPTQPPTGMGGSDLGLGTPTVS